MFELRKSFIERMQQERPGSYPIPVPLEDLSSKASQQVCRDLALRGIEEMFEALQHLKNWKPHKLTEEKEFNKEEFLEEIVDAFNYFFAFTVYNHTFKKVITNFLTITTRIHFQVTT